MKRIVRSGRRDQEVLRGEHLSVSFSKENMNEETHMPSWYLMQLLQIGAFDVKSRTIHLDPEERDGSDSESYQVEEWSWSCQCELNRELHIGRSIRYSLSGC